MTFVLPYSVILFILLEDKVSSGSKDVGVLPSSSPEGRHQMGEESDRVSSLQQPKLPRSSSNTTASPDCHSVNSNEVENGEERGFVVFAH